MKKNETVWFLTKEAKFGIFSGFFINLEIVVRVWLGVPPPLQFGLNFSFEGFP